MATDMFGGVLLIRDSPCPESARGEKAYACVVLLQKKACGLLTSNIVYLVAAALLFAIGQIFQYVISKHICQGTNHKIDGALFETFFTLLSVVMIWVFWSSITEDDWPMPTAGESTYT